MRRPRSVGKGPPTHRHEDVWALPTPGGPDLSAAPFTSVVQTHEEWAAEYANKTMRGVMHMGWAPDAVGVTVTPASARPRTGKPGCTIHRGGCADEFAAVVRSTP